MKNISFLIVGIIFGIVGTKSEFVSWFRINEMFHFESFHMYGIIGSAVVIGIIGVYLIKRSHTKSTEGKEITFQDKDMSIPRYLFGGTIFGLGWAMTGACPGPIYILVGNGYLVFLVVWFMAVVGTFFYGILKDKLPH